MPLFLIFLGVPLIEIALFIQVGGIIGLWPTLAIVVLTAIAGTYLVRSQGALALGQLRQSLDRFQDPTEPLAHGAMILFSGALLLTPGFFTDAVGFLLLVPAVRSWVMRYVQSRFRTATFHRGPDMRRPDIIDGEFQEIDPQASNAGRSSGRDPSGWTRH